MQINYLTLEKINAEHPLTDEQMQMARTAATHKGYEEIAEVYEESMRNECAKAMGHYGTEGSFQMINDAFKGICRDFKAKKISIVALQQAYFAAWDKLQRELQSFREGKYLIEDKEYLACVLKHDLRHKS